MADAPKPVDPRQAMEVVVTKYKAAGDIVHDVMKKLVAQCVEGAKIIDLCIEGDRLVEEYTSNTFNSKGKISKGIAFPTSVSVNNTVAHFSPIVCDPPTPECETTLARHDVVKLHLGAHIDGFAAIAAETLVVGATAEDPATGRRADVLCAAWHAAELAMRTVRVGAKNWAVTDAVARAAGAWDCRPVEGMLSCQQTQNVIDGKKRIILNPTEAQRKDMETFVFAEDEVYGIDILVSSGEDGKARTEGTKPTIVQRDSSVSYQLKSKTSRIVCSVLNQKAGAFPTNVRIFSDQTRARFGLQGAFRHAVIKPYDVVYTPPNTFVAAFHFTIALQPAGPLMITHPPVWYKPELVKSEKKLEDEELTALLAKPLREKRKKKAKTDGDGAAPPQE